jgi:hypothetical protein
MIENRIIKGTGYASIKEAAVLDDIMRQNSVSFMDRKNQPFYQVNPTCLNFGLFFLYKQKVEDAF